MLARLFFPAWLVVVLGFASAASAADPKPVVGPGATRDEVIDAYGWPTGQSKSGAKEVLNYPQGQVTIDNGRVEKVDFSMAKPWPAPRPRPGAPSATSVKKVDAPLDFWLASFDDAAREAARRQVRILALFTGSDWSPASKQFHDEVALQPDFMNAFMGDFVFLQLDFATRAPITPELRDRNNRLRERYGVTVYPSLLVLSPAGNVVATIDLAKLQPGDSYRARVITAVREVRDLLVAKPPPPDPVPTAVPVASAAAERTVAPVTRVDTPARIVASLRDARWLVTGAVALGCLIAAGLFWLVWRQGGGAPPMTGATMAARISDAASGLPTPAEVKQWTREKICAVTAALAESDGYVAEVRSPGGDKDVILRRPGETQPHVLVCCVPGVAGVVSAKRLRELFGTLTAEGVPTGWLVAGAGFAPDARAYAALHSLLLIDSAQLIARLRDLPPQMLLNVLASERLK